MSAISTAHDACPEIWSPAFLNATATRPLLVGFDFTGTFDGVVVGVVANVVVGESEPPKDPPPV